MNSIVKALASFRFAVVTLLLAMHLVFVGTLAQIHLDIWQVQQRYFHTWFAWVDSRWEGWSIPIPMVGGYGIGFLLLLNLSAAYLTKIRWSRRQLGIHLLHLGVISLLFGELNTSLFARESQMRLEEGDTLNYSEDLRDWELSFRVTGSSGEDLDAVVPQDLLVQGAKLDIAEIGLFATVVEVMANSRPSRSADAITFEALPEMKTPKMQDVPTVILDVIGAGRIALSRWIEDDQEISVEGIRLLASLRSCRHYKPYSVTLEAFTHEKHEGTDIDKLFSSRIHLKDPVHGEDRSILISMNEPLRHAGETFYQASFEEGGASILQVVKNPVWWLPYLSCTLVAVGMALHFALKFRYSRGSAP